MARRILVPLWIAARRVADRPSSVLLTGLGIAVATAALTALLVSQVVVEDRAVADAIGRLSVNQRLVSVSWVGRGSTEWPMHDRRARAALESLRVGEPVRAVAFRATRLGTEVVRLTAVDEPSRLLGVRAGRPPSRCGPARCELVTLDAPREPLTPRGLPVVGSATAAVGAPLDALVGSTSTAGRVFVAVGVDALARRSEVGGLFGTVTWAVPLDRGAVDSQAAAELPRRLAEIDTALRTASSGFAVHAPLDGLAAARDRAKRASRRQLLVGGQCIVVFLAFAVLAASQLRPSARETRHRLRRLRALRWQVGLEAGAYAATVALPAMIVGTAAGLVAGAAVAAAADRPAAETVGRALLSNEAVLALLALALAVVAALVATARAATLEVRGRGISAVDVAAAAALTGVGAAVAFGDTDAETLAQEGSTGTVMLLLPVLVALAGALVTARVLPGVLRLAERGAESAGVSVRLALLSLVRSSGAAAVAVACVVVTTGMAVFALSYWSTLDRNQRDAAAYAAPFDYVVTRDPTRGRYVLRTGDLARRYGSGAVGVIRRDGHAPTLNRADELTVLGVPPEAFRRMRWRADYASRSPAALERSIAYAGGRLRGITIPRDAEALVVPRSLRGDPIRISAELRRPDGGYSVVELAGATKAPAVTGSLPVAVRGGTLVGLTLGFPPVASFTAAHRASGTRAAPDVFLRGLLTLEGPRARTARVSRRLAVDFRDWVTSDGAGTGGSRGRMRLRYFLTQERTFRIRPRQPTDDRPLSVIASSSIADAAGSARVLPIRLGGASIQVRIVETARRFPTLSGDFLVVDREGLATAANASAPGSAVADAAWVSRPEGEAPALRRGAPFPVRVTSRAEVERTLRGDPVSGAASISLLAAAVVAVLLALVGLLLSVAVDARNGAAELFDLESLGFAPARLARHLWLRFAVVLGAGIAGGLVTGALASLLVAEVVAVTANATAAEPPLVPVVPWPLLALGVVAFGAIALASAAVLARRPFRADAAARPGAA